MRVERFLADNARRLGDKTAVVAGGRRYTYAELDRKSDRLAAALIAGGVGRGDRVVVFMDNCFEAVIAIFAVLKAGAAFSPMNPSTKADKVALVLNDCRAAAIVTQKRLAAVATAAASQAPSVVLGIIAGAAPPGQAWRSFEAIVERTDPPPALPPPGISIDLAMLIYTSGSTSRPKGVMMTHDNMVAATSSCIAYLGNHEGDVLLCVLPISHSYGLYQVITAIAVGATVVLEKSFTFRQTVFQRMVDEGVTGFALVPTIAAIIVQAKVFDPDRFRGLRYITNAAAALPTAHIRRLREMFPSAQLISMYGQTECKRCTYLPSEEIDRRPDSVGIAIPNTEVTVVDERGDRVGPGIVGELVVRGPHVMKGYWGNPALTDQALRPGPLPGEKVLHTGDLFRADADGFLYFVCRKDDIIKTRGEKVDPREVENVLHGLPGVAEAAVVGVDDPILGHAIKAVVVPGDGAAVSAEDVIRHCARHSEDFMVPKYVEFRRTLPKTDSGKISRRLLATNAMEAAE